MDVDPKFIREIKCAVKPEYLVDQIIWEDWNKKLRSSGFYNLRVKDVARSKRLTWPTNKSEETFGDFLNMDFARIKVTLGWDAKRTLLVCLAEECLLHPDTPPIRSGIAVTVRADNKDVVSLENILEDPKSADESPNTDKEEATEVCLKILTELKASNSSTFSLTERLEAQLRNVVEKNQKLTKAIAELTSNNPLRTSLDELTKAFQAQSREMDLLRQENKRLLAEINDLKNKFRTSQPKVGIQQCTEKNKHNNILSNKAKIARKHMYGGIPFSKQNVLPDRVQPREELAVKVAVPPDSYEDIKI